MIFIFKFNLIFTFLDHLQSQQNPSNQTFSRQLNMAPLEMDWVTARNRKDKVVNLMKNGDWRAVMKVVVNYLSVADDNSFRSFKEMMSTGSLSWSGSDQLCSVCSSYRWS